MGGNGNGNIVRAGGGGARGRRNSSAGTRGCRDLPRSQRSWKERLMHRSSTSEKTEVGRRLRKRSLDLAARFLVTFKKALSTGRQAAHGAGRTQEDNWRGTGGRECVCEPARAAGRERSLTKNAAGEAGGSRLQPSQGSGGRAHLHQARRPLQSSVLPRDFTSTLVPDCNTITRGGAFVTAG